MIRVTVELLPNGDESRKRLLGTAAIANDGTGSLSGGNYDVLLLTGEPPIAQRAGRVWRRGRVEGFDRKASPWLLLKLALEACLGKGSLR